MTDTAVIVVGGISYRIRRASVADLDAIVGLLRDDVLGRDREPVGMAPYERAFAAIDADPNQLLLVVTDPGGRVVATMQVSFLPGLSAAGRCGRSWRRCGWLRMRRAAASAPRSRRTSSTSAAGAAPRSCS